MSSGGGKNNLFSVFFQNKKTNEGKHTHSCRGADNNNDFWGALGIRIRGAAQLAALFLGN